MTEPEDLHLFDAVHRANTAAWMVHQIGVIAATGLGGGFLAALLVAFGWVEGVSGVMLLAALFLIWHLLTAHPPAPPMQLLDIDEDEEESTNDERA